MDAIEKRHHLAAEMHELADFLATTADPTINYLPVSHWDLMETMLRAFCPKPAQLEPILLDPRAGLALVLSEVSLQMRMPAPVILSAGRQQRISIVRQIAMYLSRRVCDVSYPEIGKFFHRDHSTVIHAENFISRRMENEPAFARTIDKMCSAIRCRADRMAAASKKAA